MLRTPGPIPPLALLDLTIESSRVRSSKRSKPHPMKTIDWKTVTHDKKLTTQYNVAVYNKFQELSDNIPLELENVNEIYKDLSQAAEEIALDLLPKKKKANMHQPCSTIKVTEARERLKRISQEYHRLPSTNMKIALISAKKDLDDAYLDGEISDIQKLHIANRHHSAWKTIKETSGKNYKRKIHIKGG